MLVHRIQQGSRNCGAIALHHERNTLVGQSLEFQQRLFHARFVIKDLQRQRMCTIRQPDTPARIHRIYRELQVTHYRFTGIGKRTRHAVYHAYADRLSRLRNHTGAQQGGGQNILCLGFQYETFLKQPFYAAAGALACAPNPRPSVYTSAMTPETPPSPHATPRKRLYLGGLLVLLASVLLHLIILAWARGLITLPSGKTPDDTMVIAATLETEAPSPPKPKIVAAAKPKPRPRPAKPVPAIAPAAEPPAETNTAASEPETGVASNEQIAVEEELAPSVAEAENSIAYKIDLPPSASLKYDIQKIPKEGSPMYGSGTISWHTDGHQYTVDGDFGVLFITALRFRSSGSITDIGIVPELYSEKRFRRSETNTHFQREPSLISFSASTQSYPRTGGEQDRASIIWQLAGIGRGDSEKFVAGASIDLFVAGTRDAETWHILVIGQEEIMIDGVSTTAWHVARAPKRGSYDQKLDIWLAPQQNWYPVRLRYTEANGDYLDMSLTSLNVSAPH